MLLKVGFTFTIETVLQPLYFICGTELLACGIDTFESKRRKKIM